MKKRDMRRPPDQKDPRGQCCIATLKGSGRRSRLTRVQATDEAPPGQLISMFYLVLPPVRQEPRLPTKTGFDHHIEEKLRNIDNKPRCYACTQFLSFSKATKLLALCWLSKI